MLIVGPLRRRQADAARALPEGLDCDTNS